MRSDPGDRVQVVIAGGSYRNWYEVDIDSDIFNPADAFAVKAKVPEPQFVGAFREGQKCDVYIGEDRQMAGVIDDVEFSGELEKERLTLTGRDLGAFLVDNEAEAIKAANYTIKTLAEKLLKSSFGIKNVILSNEDNRKLIQGKKDRKSKAGTSAAGAPVFGAIPRARTKIDAGKKIWQILEEHAKRLGVTMWLTAKGDLFIGKPNYKQTPSYTFVCYAARSANAQKNNILDYRVRRSIAERCSEITVNGVSVSNESGGMFTSSTAAKQNKFHATVTDPDLTSRGIERKLILADNDCASQAMAQRRAEFEMELRRMKGITIELTVPGFRQSNRLFAIDTLAHVKIEAAGIDGTFYVVQRRFLEDVEKRRTQLTLHDPGVWLA